MGRQLFDAKARKWTTTATGANGEPLKRGFCEFCLAPIYQIINTTINENTKKLQSMLVAFKITLAPYEEEAEFLPAADTLLTMIVVHLPSPVKAQAYR